VLEHNGDRRRNAAFGAQGLFDASDIIVGDPVSHEGARRAEFDVILAEVQKSQFADPRLENGLSEFAAQPVARRRPDGGPVGSPFQQLCHFPRPFNDRRVLVSGCPYAED
jgi:hypothetical protein